MNWWSYELSWFGRWHIKICLEWWGRYLGRWKKTKTFWHFGLRVLLWLIEMKMIRKAIELKEGLTCVRKMEVTNWSVNQQHRAVFRLLIWEIWRFCFQYGEGDLYDIVACLKSCLAKSSLVLTRGSYFVGFFAIVFQRKQKTNQQTNG